MGGNRGYDLSQSSTSTPPVALGCRKAILAPPAPMRGFFQGRLDILHAEGHVLKALALFLDEFRHGAVRGRRLQELDFALAHREEGSGDLLLRHGLGAFKLQPEHIGPEILAIVDAVDSDSQMIDFEYLHAFLLMLNVNRCRPGGAFKK